MAGRERDAAGGGFILIEILVALSIMAVMAALMAGVFSQLRAVGHVREQVLAQTELSAAVAHLQRTLSGIRRAPLVDDEPDAGHLLDGTAGQMRFAAVTRQGFHSLALRNIRISVEPGDGVLRLVQTHALRRPEAAGGEPALTVVILEDISGVSFEYSPDGVSYAAVWNASGELPAVVRMTISRDVAGRPVSVSGTVRLL